MRTYQYHLIQNSSEKECQCYDNVCFVLSHTGLIVNLSMITLVQNHGLGLFHFMVHSTFTVPNCYLQCVDNKYNTEGPPWGGGGALFFL